MMDPWLRGAFAPGPVRVGSDVLDGHLMNSPFVIDRFLAGVLAMAAVAIVGGFFEWILRGNQAGTDVSPRRKGLKALVIGSDNRASTSKLQASLWTVAVFFALTYLLFLGRSIGCGEEANRTISKCAAARSLNFNQIIAEPLQAEYFVLLGFPLAAALSAKALTTSKIAGGSLTKDKLPKEEQGTARQGLSEVVTNDRGEVDLLDFQYFAFNLLALGFFFVEFLTDPGEGLPDLPTTLIALAGLSAASYTTKKALETDEKPGITTVIPRRIPLVAGQVVVIRGSGFEKTPPPEDPADRRITLNGVAFPDAEVSWSPTRIEVRITETMVGGSKASPDGTPVEAELQVDMGGDLPPCDPYTVELYRPSGPPAVIATAPTGTTITGPPG